MENYAYAASYPESGDSSPRSREIDFENPPTWEDQQNQNQNQNQNYKVKFMCSYDGKIHPRPHDNQLSYIGGETKILAVDRSIKFSSLLNKLSVLCDADNVSFKYQLPGEDLDALISVTNDDDLEHMMHEYDRLYKASPKPARLRLFLFPASQRSFGSDDCKSEKERFVDALNSSPTVQASPSVPVQNNMDFLFGLEKGISPPVQHLKGRDPASAAVHEMEAPIVHGLDDRAMASDPIQKHIQDLQRLRLEEHHGLYRRKSDENLAGAYSGGGGEYYVQKMPEKVAQVNVQGTGPIPAGYWQEKQVTGGVYQPASLGGEQQPVYMIPAHSGAYHAPIMRGGVSQGYYAVQRMSPEVYRDQQQQVYNVIQSAPQPVAPVAASPSNLPQAAPQKLAAAAAPVVYSEGIGIVRSNNAGGVGVVESGGYAQMAYDSGIGRQVYYNTPGGVVAVPPPSQPSAAAHYQEGSKAAAKTTQPSG